jgi:uncharacterized membrane protein YqiK
MEEKDPRPYFIVIIILVAIALIGVLLFFMMPELIERMLF